MAVKTNAMRILDSMKIPYTLHTYTCDEFIDGEQIADMLGLPYEKVYKTLVAQGSSKNYYVFVIPIAEKLDMKKAAAAVGENPSPCCTSRKSTLSQAISAAAAPQSV